MSCDRFYKEYIGFSIFQLFLFNGVMLDTDIFSFLMEKNGVI